MKLLVGMNLSPRWVAFPASENLDAVHWSEVGSANASDVGIMQFAAVNDWVVLTHDLDFGAILAATQGNKPSVVQLRSMMFGRRSSEPGSRRHRRPWRKSSKVAPC